MKYELIETFFDDLSDYMRFFMQLKEARRATNDFSCVAVLEKEDDKYLYTLQWEDGRFLADYVKPFRPNEENLRLFHEGCAEMARRLRIFLETGDEKQVPIKPPPFGKLTYGAPDETAPLPTWEDQATDDRKYFPAIQEARLVKRYDAKTYDVSLLTDVKCIGIIRCTHLLVASKKGVKEPSYVIAAEVNNLGSPDEGSHFLCCYPGSGHINYGCSDEWGDLSCFEKEALELMNKELGIRIA